MHIGLIGGIGPAATDFYYRRLISTFASKKAALELTIVHADTPTLLGNLASNNAATQVAIYMKLTNRLAAAGAECVAITSVAGHFCIDAFKASSVLPVVDMISEVNRAIEKKSLRADRHPRNPHGHGDAPLWRRFQRGSRPAQRPGSGRRAPGLCCDGSVRHRYRSSERSVRRGQ